MKITMNVKKNYCERRLFLDIIEYLKALQTGLWWINEILIDIRLKRYKNIKNITAYGNNLELIAIS